MEEKWLCPINIQLIKCGWDKKYNFIYPIEVNDNDMIVHGGLTSRRSYAKDTTDDLTHQQATPCVT